MEKEKNEANIYFSIEQLPPDLRLEVDHRIADYKNTYNSICEYIESQGYKTSRSILCHYAKNKEIEAERKNRGRRWEKREIGQGHAPR